MNKLILSFILIGIVILIIYNNLLSRYNSITAFFDLYTIGLVYPQCEFVGEDLNELNSISSKMGFRVSHVDCSLFNTRGMNHYYEKMVMQIEKINGENWLDQLYEERRSGPI